MPDDLRAMFQKVTKGSLSGDTPDKGVVGIAYFDGYLEKAGIEFLEEAAKKPDTPGRPAGTPRHVHEQPYGAHVVPAGDQRPG